VRVRVQVDSKSGHLSAATSQSPVPSSNEPPSTPRPLEKQLLTSTQLPKPPYDADVGIDNNNDEHDATKNP